MVRPRIGLLALLVLLGCDSTGPSVHLPEVVLEAYLAADRPLSTVRLTYTEAIGRTYNSAGLGVAGASVRIERLGAEGQPEASYPFIPDSDEPGVYWPAPTASPIDDRVVPGRTYRLVAQLADGSLVQSETTVPSSFEAVRVSDGPIAYRGRAQYEMDLTPSTYPGRQGIFVISIAARDPLPENLTPFYLDTIYDVKAGEEWNPAEADTTLLAEYLINASPPINEANYEVNADGTLRVRLPWFAVVFYGVNTISISAIDDNIYDFVRFQAAQQGGASLSPGEIPNLLDHVQGGTGVFGSYARVTGDIEITP